MFDFCRSIGTFKKLYVVTSIISYALSLSLFLDSLRQVSTFPDVSCVLLQARLELKVYLHHHTVITLRTGVILAVAVTQATIGAIPIGCFVLATHTARFFRLFDSNFRCRNLQNRIGINRVEEMGVKCVFGIELKN